MRRSRTYELGEPNLTCSGEYWTGLLLEARLLIRYSYGALISLDSVTSAGIARIVVCVLPTSGNVLSIGGDTIELKLPVPLVTVYGRQLSPRVLAIILCCLITSLGQECI